MCVCVCSKRRQQTRIHGGELQSAELEEESARHALQSDGWISMLAKAERSHALLVVGHKAENETNCFAKSLLSAYRAGVFSCSINSMPCTPCYPIAVSPESIEQRQARFKFKRAKPPTVLGRIIQCPVHHRTGRPACTPMVSTGSIAPSRVARPPTLAHHHSRTVTSLES